MLVYFRCGTRHYRRYKLEVNVIRFVLYGLPCAGKTTLLNGLDIKVINGSVELNKLSSGRFSELDENEKNLVRVQYAKRLSEMTGTLISDGHYAFPERVVFTEADAKAYDVFLYLYCAPEIIRERLCNSEKNVRFSGISAENIGKWQHFEIEELRRECHERNKDFYVVNDISSNELTDFIQNIENGFSSFRLAKKIVEQIKSVYPEPCNICICDGDKTVINRDSFRVCSNNYITHAFDGDFYTGFQSMRFDREVGGLQYDYEKIDSIELNERIYNEIIDKNYFVISSGIGAIWERISEKFGLKNVIADTLISADTKYFIVKLLQENGYTVTAYGDSKNDLYMLKKADNTYLNIGERISRSLSNEDISGIKLIYDSSPYILNKERSDLTEYISVCKSNSGINGALLAKAHFVLGQAIGEKIVAFLPNKNTAVLVLERGGRFFGDGLYTKFGGTFYAYNSKESEQPNIFQDNIIIVDSVINSGKSVLEVTEKLKAANPNAEIFIAVNVIQKNAIELLCDHKIFAVRISENSFVGSRQNSQKNGKGPDTADRLFNLID